MGDCVWAVSSGAYSDYSVHCCFSTEELANAYAAQENGITPELQKVVDTAPRAEAERMLREAGVKAWSIYGMAFVESFQFWTELPNGEVMPS